MYIIRSTHNDEMCNVYSMYSYEPANTKNGKPPAVDCWGEVVQNMSR